MSGANSKFSIDSGVYSKVYKPKMSKKTVQKFLSKAGIKVNGPHPWDIRIINDEFYGRVLRQGTLGAGESYVEGWWECERLDEAMAKVFRAKLDRNLLTWHDYFDSLKGILLNPQIKLKTFHNAQRHYDIGHDLYEKMLDRRLLYSCAYWNGAKNLNQAQENKLELICKKIGLRPGMKLLDIGCGWGGFPKFAAGKYKAEVVGITVSKDQYQFAKRVCSGYPIKIKLQDYRDLDGKFDRIVSIGMFEHVGHKNYQKFMEIAHRCLKENGIFLLHTIGGNRSETCTNPWIQKYIFPNSMLPSIRQIGKVIEDLFVMEDWHNLGTDYDRTLLAWFKNFNRHWKEIRTNYGEEFYRMWKFYLLSCAGAFRARKIQVWQILLSKNGAGVRTIR